MSTAPVVETPLPVSAIAVQRRIILRPGKDDLAFSFALDATADEQTAFQLMDFVTTVADREDLKAQLREKHEALRVAEDQPKQLLKEIDRLRVQRATLLAAQRATSEARGKREFRPTEKQTDDLAKYDAQIQAAGESIKSFSRDIPIIRWECACLAAKIAGEPEPAPPRELEDAIDDLREAAE